MHGQVGAESGRAMTTEIRTIGVVGAGQMGNGIAHVCALAGMNVRLNDLSEDRIRQGLATIRRELLTVWSSPLSESNRRPTPYHGVALPTELRGQWRADVPQTSEQA